MPPTKAIVTDIEGTTSSIHFVKDVLFPYSTAHLPDFVRTHAADAEVQRQLQKTAELADMPDPSAVDTETLIAVLLGWIREDRKATPLKALQGLVWEAGYRRGDFKAHMYPDATAKLREWHAAAVPLYVYSSGSIYAQKLFFAHTEAGDLTPLFSGYFDTTIGPKTDPDSYRAIRREIGHDESSETWFLSDIPAELDAAKIAGFRTIWVVRDDATSTANAAHLVVPDFDAITL